MRRFADAPATIRVRRANFGDNIYRINFDSPIPYLLDADAQADRRRNGQPPDP